MMFFLLLCAVVSAALAKHCVHTTDSETETTPLPTTPAPPTGWPEGTFALPMTISGCETDWLSGSFYHDSEDNGNANSWNTSHLGGFNKKEGFLRSFCVNDDDRSGTYSWPAGSYCILKKYDCPEGFQEGSILWDDENTHNTNHVFDDGEGLPDGEFEEDTKLMYCCREDAVPSTEIYLPVTSPFYLLMKVSECQEVAGMTVAKEMIAYDDEDMDNHNARTGSTPFNTGTRRDHGMMYCYYERNST